MRAVDPEFPQSRSVLGAFESFETSPFDLDGIPVPGDIDREGPKDRKRGSAILTPGETLEPRTTRGERREQRESVADGLVARRLEAATQPCP